MSTVQDLPHWQLASIFSGLEGQDYLTAKSRVKAKLSNLKQLMNTKQVQSGSRLELNKANLQLFEDLLTNYNQLTQELFDLRAFTTGFTSTDAFNNEAKAEGSQLLDLISDYSILTKRFTAWLGRLDLAELARHSELAKVHSFGLSKARENAQHLMDDDSEALASLLDKTGGSAWARLHSDLVSRSSIKAAISGESKSEFTLSELKNLQTSVSAKTRQQAYETELELLSQHEVSFAAAMNSIKGQMNDLTTKRKWSSVLEQAVHQNNISMRSLEAMLQACQESFPAFRRYLKAKATFLDKDALAWYDLLAPVSIGQARHFSWEEAQTFVTESFESYSQELANYAKKSFQENWLDVPPRKGKRNGAFCMAVPGRKESRIMLNFGNTLDDVFTLAHELGHGYHNEQMYKAGRSSLQRNTPMTLAETASIFCETIVVNAMLETASEKEKLAILEQDLLGATQLVIDIYSRFLLKKTFVRNAANASFLLKNSKVLCSTPKPKLMGTPSMNTNVTHSCGHKKDTITAQRAVFTTFPIPLDISLA